MGKVQREEFAAFFGDFEVLTRTPRQQFGCVPGHFVILKGNNPTYQQNHTKPTTPKSIDDSSLPWHAMAMARVKYGMVMPTLLASFLGEDRGSVISTWSRLLGFPNRNGPTALTDIKSIQSILGVHCTRWLNLGRLFFIVNSLEKKNFTKRGLRKGAHFQTFSQACRNYQQPPAATCPRRQSLTVQRGQGHWPHYRLETVMYFLYMCRPEDTHVCIRISLQFETMRANICVWMWIFFWIFQMHLLFHVSTHFLIVTSKRIVHLQISLLEICNMTSEIIIIN